MGDRLLPLPLTERSVHLCVDMQRIVSAEGPWPTPWMDRVLPVADALASRHPERTVFTRFVPPERPDEMPGMWQRYYTRWRAATRERLDFRLLDLMPPLAGLCPPATVIDKTRYSAFAEPGSNTSVSARRTRSLSPDRRPMFACWQRCWTRLTSATGSSSCARRYAVLLMKGTRCLCGSTTPDLPSR
jgi:Isochorismatase family